MDGTTFLAVVDCTGHGVPGALMSVVGHNLLNQIVRDTGIDRPEAILKTLDRRIRQTLRQNQDGDSHDGMDVALLAFEAPSPAGRRKVRFAGAGRPLWLRTADGWLPVKSGRFACGGAQQADKSFPTHELLLNPGDRLYIFTDGVTDQFGGPKGRKLGTRNLQQWLESMQRLPMEEQGKLFAHTFGTWKATTQQTDDVLLIGLEC